MSRIQILDAATSNAIAAGEVIERPMSIVKELMENSIDAGATQITVEIADGGITLIRVRDNGCGMDEEDAQKAFICHATSKLRSLDELFSLHSMGFRGEALASIAAAARVTLSTKEPLAEKGTCVRYEGGQFISCEPIGMPSGTTVEVRDLFYNLPARFKFLKKDQTEANYIQVLIERFILCHTDVSFKFIKNGKTVLQSPGNCDPSSALYSVYGKEICSACRPINSTIDGITVKGFVGLPKIARASRSEQIIFVNQRLIRSKTITSAIDSAYTNMLMKGKYAFVILDILIPSADLDVNVHPQKAEVRFSNESMIYRAVYHAIVNTLSAETMSVEFEFNKGDNQKETNNAAPLQAPVPTAAKPEITVAAEQKPEVSDRPSPAISVPASTPVSKPSVDYSKNIGYSNLYFKEQEKAYTVPETLSAPVIGTKEPEVQPEVIQEAAPSVENILDMVPQSREESLHELTSSRVIGTLFDTYILLETKDRTLLMIDQHAAHEKVLYEQLVAQELEKKVVSQPLIAPVIVSMSRSDISFIEEHSKDLEDIGFEVSSMGDSELAIRSVPAQVDPQSVSSAFIEMVDEWMHESKTRKDALILSLATSACKAAVKGHDKLHDIEIKRLLEDLSVLKDPYHCPHGRPILIRLSEKEIEKEFKRIV
ncbi:MAG: DNA mismatch repair endonuclease MutL [Clostridiales bacterium]|nr:DNA mismatch repair endonuclease MutL [Clostridiales bacterium]MBP5417645.1 DNA mismatch repair endonuclease MutL [Clostridiales bacterium]